MAGGAKAMKALQIWCRQKTDGYRDVEIKDMTKSWRDGMAFCALVHKYRPDLIDYDSLSKENVFENNKLAFEVAERELGIPALLDAEDMVALQVPDRLSIITYVAQMYNYFKDHTPQGGPGVKKFKGSQPSKKRHTDSPANNAPESKKPSSATTPEVPKTKIGTPAQTKEKTRTIGETCTICKKKIYILERVRIDGKFYHRSCHRESQIKDKEYRSVLLAKPVSSDSIAKEPAIKSDAKTNVVSPTSVAAAKARSNFFQADNVSNKSEDSGYQSPNTWRRNDANALPAHNAKADKVSPTSPVLTAVSNSTDNFVTDKSKSDNPWILRSHQNKDNKEVSQDKKKEVDKMDRLRKLKEKSPFGNRSPKDSSPPEEVHDKGNFDALFNRKSPSQEKKRELETQVDRSSNAKLSPSDGKLSPMEIDRAFPLMQKRSGQDEEREVDRHSPMETETVPHREKRKSSSPTVNSRTENLKSRTPGKGESSVNNGVREQVKRNSRSPDLSPENVEQRRWGRKSRPPGLSPPESEGQFVRKSRSPTDNTRQRNSKSRSPVSSPSASVARGDLVRRRSRSPELCPPEHKGRVVKKSPSPEQSPPEFVEKGRFVRRARTPEVATSECRETGQFVRRSISPQKNDVSSPNRAEEAAEKRRQHRDFIEGRKSPSLHSPEKLPSSYEENRLDRKSRSPERRRPRVGRVENKNFDNRSQVETNSSPVPQERRRSHKDDESAIGRLDALVQQKAEREVPQRPKAAPHFPSHVASDAEQSSHPSRPVPRPRSRRDSSGSPIPRPRSPRTLSKEVEMAPPKPARTFGRDVEPNYPPNPQEDPALSGLMKSLAEARARKARPHSDALLLDHSEPRGSPEPRPRRRSLREDEESVQRHERRNSPPKRPPPESQAVERHQPRTRHAQETDERPTWQREAERRQENIRQSNTPEALRKKRAAPAKPDDAIPEWQKAAQERQAANKGKFNRFGSRMQHDIPSDDLSPTRPESLPQKRSPRPTRPENIPVHSHQDRTEKGRLPDHKLMRPARPPAVIHETRVHQASNNTKDHFQKPSRPHPPVLADESKSKTESKPYNLTDRDKRAKVGQKLTDVIRQKTRSLNPFGSDSEDETDGGASEPQQTVIVKKAKPVNPFDSDEDETEEEKVEEKVKAESPPSKAKESQMSKSSRPVRLNPFDSSEDEEPSESTPAVSKPAAQRPPVEQVSAGVGRKKITVDRQFDFDKSIESSGRHSPTPAKPKKKGRAPAPPRPLSPPVLVPPPQDNHRSESPRGLRAKKGPAPARPLPPKRNVYLEPHLSNEAIQKELAALDRKQTELERQGREIEEALRNEAESGEDDSMLVKFFEMVNEKNQLLRQENDLVLIAQRQVLEAKHSDVEYQIRLLMNKPENKKTDNEKREEQVLVDKLVEIVTERSKIEEQIEMERIRAQEEDEQIAQVMALKLVDGNVQNKKKKEKKKKK